ncbi:MAG: hypothetical protein Q4D62_09400 [Planctomycetia bacterium]|nr:hypothetical protein [Planctomycetia bacterium]
MYLDKDGNPVAKGSEESPPVSERRKIEMELNELLEKYDFHDSGLERIQYDSAERRAEMEVEFCNWMQDYFQKGMVKQPIVSLVFTEVSEMKYAGLEQYDEGNVILQASLIKNPSNQEGVEFLVYNDETNQLKHIRIFAEEVEFVVVGAT